MTDEITIKARKIISILGELETALDDLDGIEQGAVTRYFGDSLRDAIGQAEVKRGFYPAIWGDPARPSRQAQAIRSAELGVDKAREMLADLRSRRRTEDIDQDVLIAASERLESAELQLARMRGETGNDQAARKKADRIEAARQERLAEAASIRQAQERARGLVNAK